MNVSNMEYGLAKEVELLYQFFEKEFEKYKGEIDFTFDVEDDSRICIRVLSLNPAYHFSITNVYYSSDRKNVVCSVNVLPSSQGSLKEYIQNRWMKNVKKYDWSNWLSMIRNYNKMGLYQKKLHQKYSAPIVIHGPEELNWFRKLISKFRILK